MGTAQVTGNIEAALSLAGEGIQADASQPEPVIIVTFQVSGTGDSSLAVTKADVRAIVGAVPNQSTVSVPVTIASGSFFAPPQIDMTRWNASVPSSNKVNKLSLGERTVTLLGAISMDPKAPRAGFVYIVFDITDPKGNSTTLVSNTIIIFPGQKALVTTTFTYAPVTGTYTEVPTIFLGPATAPGFFIPGPTTQGTGFTVLP